MSAAAAAGTGSGAGSSPVGLMCVFCIICISSGVGSGRGTPYERWVVSCGSAPSAMRVGLNLKYSRALSSSVPTMASESTPSDFSWSDVDGHLRQRAPAERAVQAPEQTEQQRRPPAVVGQRNRPILVHRRHDEVGRAVCPD